MRGTLISAWPQAAIDLWQPLADSKDAPQELFSELYPELMNACRKPTREEGLVIVSAASHMVTSPRIERDEMAANDSAFALECFTKLAPEEFASERRLVRFFEQAYFIIEDFESRGLSILYRSLVAAFLTRYNLRYQLIEPFQIIPRFSQLFAGMLEEIERSISGEAHLTELHTSVRHAFEDLCSRGRPADVSTCIARVCNLAEGLARRVPDVTADTLGAAARELTCWPHRTIQNALTAIYGFCSDYPGVRHAGNPEGRLRDLDVRDAVVVSMLLLAFTGYLCEIDFTELLGTKMTSELERAGARVLQMAAGL